MALNFYDLDLDVQMMVSCLEEYHGFDFKKALMLIEEYQVILQYLRLSAEENVQILLKAKCEKVSGVEWLMHIEETKDFLGIDEDGEEVNYLPKIDKINKRKHNQLVQYDELDYYEKETIQTLMMVYRFDFQQAMGIWNDYLLDCYRLNNYHITGEEWAIYMNYAFEHKVSLEEALNHAEEEEKGIS